MHTYFGAPQTFHVLLDVRVEGVDINIDQLCERESVGQLWIQSSAKKW